MAARAFVAQGPCIVGRHRCGEHRASPPRSRIKTALTLAAATDRARPSGSCPPPSATATPPTPGHTPKGPAAPCTTQCCTSRPRVTTPSTAPAHHHSHHPHTPRASRPTSLPPTPPRPHRPPLPRNHPGTPAASITAHAPASRQHAHVHPGTHGRPLDCTVRSAHAAHGAQAASATPGAGTGEGWERGGENEGVHEIARANKVNQGVGVNGGGLASPIGHVCRGVPCFVW